MLSKTPKLINRYVISWIRIIISPLKPIDPSDLVTGEVAGGDLVDRFLKREVFSLIPFGTFRFQLLHFFVFTI